MHNIENGDNNICNSEFLDYELQYAKKFEELRANNSVDRDLMDIYCCYGFKYDNKIFEGARVYIAYGYDDNDNLITYIVLPRLGNYDIINAKEYKLHKTRLVQLRQTTLFIELLSKNLIVVNKDKRIIELNGDKDKINECLNKWDGKLHDLVPETFAIDDKVIIKDKR